MADKIAFFITLGGVLILLVAVYSSKSKSF